VLYMDFVFGPGDNYVRNDRLGLEAFVPYMPTPAPALTAISLAATPSPPAPAPDSGFPWIWTILAAALLAAAVGWAVIRRRRSTRR
jgi:hypothetical protein